MKEQFTIAVLLTVKHEFIEEFHQRLNASLAATRADEGCIVFDIHRVIGDESKWFLYEGWRSKADSDKHQAKPEVSAWLKDWERLLAKPPEITNLELTSERKSPATHW